MRITLIGLGAGTTETLTLAGRERLRRAQAVLGAPRLLEGLETETAAARMPLYRPDEVLAWLGEHPDCGEACVVFSGDTGFYSGARQLAPRLREAGYPVEVLPGIASVQMLSARLGIPWQDLHLVSAHGVECDVLAHVLNHERCFFLTGGSVTPGSICRVLCEAGLGDAAVTVAQRLASADERVETATARQLAAAEFDALSVVLVERRTPTFCWPAARGVPDKHFLRGKAPMTKQEVRSVILSKLAIRTDDVAFDLGAGTGSVSVEMALAARWGRVYAVENAPPAYGLLLENRKAFGVYNLVCVEGTAPEALEGLPVPDVAFIGGSKGRLREMMERLHAMNPRIRMVVSAVTLETLAAATAAMDALGLADVETVQVAVSRTEQLGRSRLLRAQNPIFLVCGGTRDE